MIRLSRAVALSTLLLAAGLRAAAQESTSTDMTKMSVDEGDLSPILAALPEAKPIAVKFDCQPASGRPPVQLGDAVVCVAELQHVPADIYEPPAVLSWGDGWQQLSLETARSEGDPCVMRLRVVLQAVALGRVPVPPLTLMVKGPDGARRFSLPPTELAVEGIIDPARTDVELREPEVKLPLRWVDRRWPLLVPVGLLAIWLVLRWLRRRRHRVVPAPVLAPAPEALARFDQLRASNAAATGQQQALHFALSETVRRYLHRRFAIDALECTTDELLLQLQQRQTPVPGLDREALAAFLRTADLVKFANLAPDAAACDAAIAAARAVVTSAETAAVAEEKSSKKNKLEKSKDDVAGDRPAGGAS